MQVITTNYIAYIKACMHIELITYFIFWTLEEVTTLNNVTKYVLYTCA